MIKIDMEMPDCCANCRFMLLDCDDALRCLIEGKCIDTRDHYYYDETSEAKPQWCPLKEIMVSD